ncbi:protein kinase family protein [Kitasatospora cineracea]|uniref:Serine/threonine protein kinase n=1 Tax=Kitasatospora cineracea TaxID=88074 RepID=A0A8G1XD09_9ACTN|nr:protein kinase family protein [Kitasatospora cineracea]ROR38179.1 serine/threonine protein kinase [Kitasatospora cineracea]
MDPAATPGEIFVPRKASGIRTRLVTDGTVTREMPIIGHLGPAYEVFAIQSGGHGEIYFCVPTDEPDPPVAFVCKQIPRQVLLDPVRRRAFLRECVLAVRMTALPGFVSSDILWVGGLPTLVTAAVLPDDDDVANLLDVVNGPQLPVPVAGFLAWAVAESMSTALNVHPEFVHGDLKPENVLVQAGAPLITDFGLASTLRHGWGQDSLPGTPPYLAPEARRPDARLTLATDIYAFGIILRQLLDNCQAADSGPHTAALDLIAELALRCTADAPEQRPIGFAEIAQRLKRTFDESDPAVRRGYGAYQLLAILNITNSVVFPDYESLARIEEWDLLRELIESQPAKERLSSAWHMHGLALTRMGRDFEALKSFETALARARWETEKTGRPMIYGPDEDAIRNIRFDIAVLLVNMGRFREAEDLGRELVADAASDEAARRAKTIVAMALINSGRLDGGEQLLITAMAGEHDEGRLAEGFRALSVLRLQQGRPDAAIEAMQRAVQLTPGRASHHRNLGELLAQLGEPGLAVAAFDHAMQCGDLTQDVLAMRLACAIAADDRKPDSYRAEADRQFGAERVDDAWQAALDILANARELEPAEATALTATGAVGETLNYDELQVEIDDARFYTFDYYTDGDEPDLVADFTARHREMVTTITSAKMRGAPVVCTRCSGCGTEILTNRPVGTAFTCVRCETRSDVSPLLDEPHRELHDAIGQALDMTEEPADGQGRCLVVQPWEPGTDAQIERVHEAARRHGLDPVSPDHAAVVLAFVEGISVGRFTSHHQPIGAIYLCPQGSRHIPRMPPAPVEDYLVEVRKIFGGRVNSSSHQIDYTREDPGGHILADRLDLAAEQVHDDPDVTSRRTTLILLSQLRLNRGQPEIALHLADEAVRLDRTDENAWIAKGYAELVRGDVTAAKESLREAQRDNSASSGATALQATIEYLSGDEDAPFTLARAITLGAIFRPPGGESSAAPAQAAPHDLNRQSSTHPGAATLKKLNDGLYP